MIDTYIALDTETTGVSASSDRIIEIGMAKVVDGNLVDTYRTLIDPQMHISDRITQITGITNDDVAGKPVMADVIGDIMAFLEDFPILGHNVIFDYKFLKKAALTYSYTFEREGIDTLKMARRILPDLPHKSLEYLCAQLGINPGNSHRAYDDAISAMQLYRKLYEIAPTDKGFTELIPLVAQVKKESPITPAQVRYLNSLVAKHGLALEDSILGMTKSSASRLIDEIISTHGK